MLVIVSRVLNKSLTVLQHNVTMHTTLTTFDGYPRSDIDVAQIRTTRARIVRLKNDYKSLSEKIEKGLHEHWANASSESASASTSISATSSSRQQTNGSASTAASSAIEAPFAKVNSVVPSSPADTAGLKAGDKITRFGYANWMNHEKLAKVAQVVQQNEGREIVVRVLRPADIGGGSETVEVRLVPRHNWGGRGMLGCHLLPL